MSQHWVRLVLEQALLGKDYHRLSTEQLYKPVPYLLVRFERLHHIDHIVILPRIYLSPHKVPVCIRPSVTCVTQRCQHILHVLKLIVVILE